jgi:hypothetical protein
MIRFIMTFFHRPFCALLLLASTGLSSMVLGAATQTELSAWIHTVRSVSTEGQGNLEASAAMQALNEQSTEALVSILTGMKGASPLAQNWLRSSVESIVHLTRQGDDVLPLMELTEFLLNEANAPRARSLSFELIQSNDSHAGEILLRGMLNDPSNDLRRQAVEQWVQAGTNALSDKNPNTAKVIFRQALQYARDIEQIRALADELEKLEHTVDIPDLLGFITDWKVVGPFHNLKRGGFEAAFPPENELQLNAAYQGKMEEVAWKGLESDDRFGMVDINDAFPGYIKEVTAYAHHAFISDEDRPVQLRLGCKNAWKIWLNGELLFGRDEYHRGMKIDQYIMDAQLRVGRNDILVKICQNEQMEDWTIEWEFQLRVCDETGKAIHSLARK